MWLSWTDWYREIEIGSSKGTAKQKKNWLCCFFLFCFPEQWSQNIFFTVTITFISSSKVTFLEAYDTIHKKQKVVEWALFYSTGYLYVCGCSTINVTSHKHTKPFIYVFITWSLGFLKLRSSSQHNRLAWVAFYCWGKDHAMGKQCHSPRSYLFFTLQACLQHETASGLRRTPCRVRFFFFLDSNIEHLNSRMRIIKWALLWQIVTASQEPFGRVQAVLWLRFPKVCSPS